MTKYQDYVIKNGNFVGKFDEMYKLFKDPWRQSEKGFYDDLSRISVVQFLKDYEIKSCLEVGCGLGKTMQFIYSQTKIDMLGIDISKTCIERANNENPNLSFRVDSVENILNYNNFKAFFFSEITWYLLEDNLIDRLFEKMKKSLKGHFFIHNLVFYNGNQKYGNEYFTNLSEFVSFCPFKLVKKVEITNVESNITHTSSLFII